MNVMKLIVCFVLVIASQGAASMSFFNPTKTCVFSEVKARLMFNGEPLRNMKVIRQWEWHKRRSDESMTDNDGYVTFPAVYESSVTRLLPAEIVIGQQLSVVVGDQETIFWSNVKVEPEENSEYGGSKFNLACELGDEEV